MPAPVKRVHLAWKRLTSLTTVIIGVDPHKGSHTAVAIDESERRLGRLRVTAAGDQAAKLLARAVERPDRTWAAGGAGGLGHLLAQQLAAAGELVLDVQPKLGPRVRLLPAGSSNKNDTNDAFSVAVAGLRSPYRRVVRAEDHTARRRQSVRATMSSKRLARPATATIRQFNPASAAYRRHLQTAPERIHGPELDFTLTDRYELQIHQARLSVMTFRAKAPSSTTPSRNTPQRRRREPPGEDTLVDPWPGDLDKDQALTISTYLSAPTKSSGLRVYRRAE